jgi:predicted Na+-dependent transporter
MHYVLGCDRVLNHLKCMQHILVGSVGQWLIKPLLGLVLALTLVPMLGLPNAVGTGLILVSSSPT